MFKIKLDRWNFEISGRNWLWKWERFQLSWKETLNFSTSVTNFQVRFNSPTSARFFRLHRNYPSSVKFSKFRRNFPSTPGSFQLQCKLSNFGIPFFRSFQLSFLTRRILRNYLRLGNNSGLNDLNNLNDRV